MIGERVTGSKGSNTTTATTAPNPIAGAAYSNIISQAQGVAATPWQNYSGEFVSPVNPQQYAGIGNINQYAFSAQPTLGVAQNMAYNAAQPITQAQIQQYQNPWMQNVVGATQAQFNNQNVQQLQNVRGNAIAQGALGGDREAVAEAELSNQQNLAQAPVIAGLESQGYTQGVNTALTEQQALASGAYSLGNLGVAAQNAGLGGAGAQIQAGSLEQQTQQAQDTALYNQWLASRAYPFQTTQWEAGIDTGVGSQMGGTSTMTGPAPSPWSQIAGLGLGALGIVGGTGGFGSNGWVGQLGSTMFGARGGRINGVAGYDSGGGVSPLPYATGGPWEPYAGGRGWVPVANMTHGRGAPAPPRPPGQQPDPMKLGEQVAGLAKYFNTGRQQAAPGLPAAGTGPDWVQPSSPLMTGYSPSQGVAPPSPGQGSMGWADAASPLMTGYGGAYGTPSPGLARGGVVRGYADGGMPFSDDDDLPPAYQPSDVGPRGLVQDYPGMFARTYAPALHDYFTADRPLPSMTPNAAGKLPTRDPYAVPAMEEAAGYGLAAIPFGRAALAMRGAEAGRGAFQALGDIGASVPMPMRRGVAAGIAGAGVALPEMAEAFEALGPRPTVSTDEQAQIDRLNREITGLTNQRAAATRGMGPKGASIQAQAFDSQIGQRNTSIRAIMDQVAARQQAYDERLADFAKKTAPFASREPEVSAALTAAPAASFGSGAVLGSLAGRKIGPVKRAMTYGAAGLGGGLEGLIGGYYPTYADLKMPEGSAARTQAQANEENPKFWEHSVLPEAGMSAATGMLGAKFGMLRREPKVVSQGVAGPAAMPPVASGRYPALSDANAVRQYQGKLAQDSLGRWYEPGKGMVPKDYWPSPSRPSGKVMPMRAAEANGGAVRGYDDGGTVDTFDDRFAPGNFRSDTLNSYGITQPNPFSIDDAVYRPDVAPVSAQLVSDTAPVPAGVAPSSASWDAYPISMRPPTTDMRHGTLRRSDVISSVRDAWGNAGANPNTIAGVTWNIGQESNFNPTLREPDQPHWGGEAHYAHGLYQEGGQEWLNFQKWLSNKGLNPNDQRNWSDPSLQNMFGAWNLKENYPNTWAKMQSARSPQEAAAIYAREYLRPAAPYLNSRLRELGQTQGDLSSYSDGDVTLASYHGNGLGGRGNDYVPLSPVQGGAGVDWSSNSKLWPALMAAGFGMMASRSPFALQAIGEGALTGMGAYTKASELESQRAMKQSEIDMQGQRLWQQNETERRKLALDAAKLEKTPVQVDRYGTLGVPDLAHPGMFKDPITGQPIRPPGETPGASSPLAPSGTQAGGMRMISSVQLPLGKEEQAIRVFAAQANPEDIQRGQSTTPPQDETRNWGYLKSVPEDRQREIIAIDQGLQPPPSPYTLYGGKGRGADINRDLRAFDPDYDYNAFRAAYQFGAGPLGTQIRSFNTAIYHLNSLEALARKLNTTDLPAANSVINFINKQLGHPEVTNLETARQFVGGEVIKAVVGTRSGEAERQEARKMFDPNASLEQILGAADTDREFMAGQLRGLKQQYLASTHRNDFEDRYLVPEARAVLEGKRTGAAGAGAASPGATGAAGAVARPPNVPAGSLRSPSTGKWKDSKGTIYNPDGSISSKAGP